MLHTTDGKSTRTRTGRQTLPLHETHAVEVNTVEHKKAHVGVLEGGFLKAQQNDEEKGEAERQT